MEEKNISAPIRNQVETGEEAEERLEFHQQSTTLRNRLQDTAVWTAPLQDMPRRLLSSKTSRSKLTFDRECHISQHFRLPVSLMQELNCSHTHNRNDHFGSFQTGFIYSAC